MSTPRLFTRDELGELDRDTLMLISDTRGADPEGTGVTGNVLKDDLIEAILRHQDDAGLNPAVAPLPADPAGVEKRYRVTAYTNVWDHPPKAEFVATIPPDQERLLLECGALMIVAEGAPQTVHAGELIFPSAPPDEQAVEPPGPADISPTPDQED